MVAFYRLEDGFWMIQEHEFGGVKQKWAIKCYSKEEKGSKLDSQSR